jgi:hypothetical protein
MVSGWWGKGAPSTIKSVYPNFSALDSRTLNAGDFLSEELSVFSSLE